MVYKVLPTPKYFLFCIKIISVKITLEFLCLHVSNHLLWFIVIVILETCLGMQVPWLCWVDTHPLSGLVLTFSTCLFHEIIVASPAAYCVIKRYSASRCLLAY